MDTLNSILNFLGASIDELEVWTPAAIKAFRLTLKRYINISLLWFVAMMALSAIPRVGPYFVYASWVGYMISLLVLARKRATWHAAGLIAGTSVVADAARAIKDGIKRIEHFRIHEGKPEITMTPVDPKVEERKKEWTLLHQTGEWLYTLLACECAAAAYLMFVPVWTHPWIFLLSMFGGSAWIIFAEKFNIDWKDYFGKFGGWYFVGGTTYILIEVNKWHTNPGAIAVMIAIFLTLATNKHWFSNRTHKFVLFGAALAILGVILAPMAPTIHDYIGSSGPSFDLSEIGVRELAFIAVALAMIAVLLGGKKEHQHGHTN